MKTLSGTFKGCCIVNKPPILWIVWNTGGISKDEKGIIFITCAVENLSQGTLIAADGTKIFQETI